MTDTTTTTDASTTDLNTEPAEKTTTGTEPDAETQDARGEAAKYRRRLRETEAERDALNGRVEAAQRALVDHLASTVGRIRPGALWASGAKLADLLDADGNVDQAAVTTACDSAAKTLGLAHIPKPDRSQGMGGTSGNGWTDAFRPR